MALLHGCFSRFLNCRNRAKGFKYFLIQKRIITASRIYIMAKKRAMTELPTCRGLTMMGSVFFLNWNKVIKADKNKLPRSHYICIFINVERGLKLVSRPAKFSGNCLTMFHALTVWDSKDFERNVPFYVTWYSWWRHKFWN